MDLHQYLVCSQHSPASDDPRAIGHEQFTTVAVMSLLKSAVTSMAPPNEVTITVSFNFARQHWQHSDPHIIIYPQRNGAVSLRMAS